MVQPDAVGSVIQLFIGSKSAFVVVISAARVVHVVPSHFVASTCGIVVAAL